MSGRIRTDTFDNYSSDLLGVPSKEDQRKAFEDYQRMLIPSGSRATRSVLAGADLSDCYPISVEPTGEHARMLKSRLQTIRQEFVPLVE